MDKRPTAPRRKRQSRASLYEAPSYVDLRARLAANVRRIRLEADLSQEEAAHRASMPIRLFAAVEGEETNATLVTLARLCVGLEADVVELLAPVSKSKRG